MTQRVTVALDAMGGDHAPEVVVRGANVACVRHPGVRFLLFGDEDRLKALLGHYSRLAGVSTMRHSEDVVGADDRPSVALRQGRHSSMRMAIDAVRAGEADGIVSAGNTGALMAMAKTVLKTLPGIHRPAIASIVPTMRGETVMLDLGANVEGTADNLVQFAVMGEVFSRTVLGVVKPTVGIVNIGIEEIKGNETVRAAAKQLQTGRLPIEFHGFIEGDDITAGTVDVVVTEGFTGNVAIKTAEGTARMYSTFLRAAFRQTLFSRLGYMLARRSLATLRDRVDPRRYNGGMFLGLNGIAVKSHGATDVFGFANAIGFAYDMVAQGFNDTVIAELNQLHANLVGETKATAV
ncbi:MAG: phosphate acyltransferase PlsX [Alphaproteobacteria bacterium]